MNKQEDLSSLSMEVTGIIPIETQYMNIVFGDQDRHIKRIEQYFRVTIILRENTLKVIGKEKDVTAAEGIIKLLMERASQGKEVNVQQVEYLLSLHGTKDIGQLHELDSIICHTVNGKPVKPKTLGQKAYVDSIEKHMIVFGLGPAGTGKTYLAMAKAITAFKNNEVNRIILTRPAIEAGEKLGFLPGDLQSKVDPYLRPLYDALYEIMGAEGFLKNMEKGLIEVAPLAYMRGRTLDNAYIILDEAQNTTPAQMKMFLTRIGFGSKAIITGDLSQKDLAPDAKSGLDEAIHVLGKVEDIGICTLTSQDVVRHPLVQKIVSAYEAYEEKKQEKGKGKRNSQNRS